MNDGDLTGVELRRRNARTDDGQCSGAGGGGGWDSRAASRMGAVRRPGTSYTLPKSMTQRHAIFVDEDEDQRPVSEGETNQEASWSPSSTVVDVVSTFRSSLSSSDGNTANSDNDDDEMWLFSSDDEEIYLNMVSEVYWLARCKLLATLIVSRRVYVSVSL